MTVIEAIRRPPDASASGALVEIRAYRSGDRDAVRDICCRSAFRNMGSHAVINDPELFAEYWSSYYTEHEPESLLVAERKGRIVGYLMGCVNTQRYRRVMGSVVVPRVLGRLVSRAARGRYRNQPQTRRFFRWLALRSWREEPAIDTRVFPAHYHANLRRGGVGLGLYTSLALTFLEMLERKGVSHLHGQVLDSKEHGTWERMVSAFELGPQTVRLQRWERPSSLGREVLGIREPLTNRAFGASVPAFRTVLQFIAAKYRL